MAKKKKKNQNIKSSIVSSYHHFLNGDWVDPEDREVFATKIFKFIRKLDKTGRFSNVCDWDSTRFYRRISAAISTFDEVKQRFSDICPNIPGHFSLETDWYMINADPGPCYDVVEATYQISLASAIWILDRLRKCGLVEEACEYLPDDFDALNDENFPIIFDPCYSNELLRSMTYVIQQRNKDCVGKKEKTVASDMVVERVYMDLYTTENLQHQNVLSRKRFDAILSLIPKEEIDRASALFERKFWDWAERYYKSISILLKEGEKFLKQIADIKESLDSFSEKASLPPLPKPNAPYPLNFLRKTPDMTVSCPNVSKSSLFNAPIAFESVPKTVLQPPNVLLEAGDQMLLNATYLLSLESQHSVVSNKIGALYSDIKMLGMNSFEEFESKYGKDIADLWRDFSIEDPFALSFGFLYLLDNGSELPWVYAPALRIISLCGFSLPWIDHFKCQDESDCPKEASCEISENAESSSEYIPVSFVDNKRLYELNFNNSDETSNAKLQCFNLSQIFFDATGCLLPRNLSLDTSVVKKIEDCRICDGKEREFLLHSAAILNQAKNQEYLAPSASDYEEEFFEEFPEDLIETSLQDEDSCCEQDIDFLKDKIAFLQNEIKHLKKLSHESFHELQKEKKRYEELEKNISYERQELNDLRELVFNQQENLFLEESAESKIAFPYQTQKKIVVFGGHDSWSREIKSKLPSVRFIDRNMVPNSDLIRHADLVWIQSNALSHSYFYKIIDETRRYRIPVRYFSFASAVKCAEQIVESDIVS